MSDREPDRRRLPGAAACLALLLAAGCVSVNATLVNPAERHPPVHRDSVRLFTSEARIPGRYEEVALLFAEGDENLTDQSDMLAAMRKKAAELGANGLLLRDMEEPGAVERVLEAVFGKGADRRADALAIRWGTALEDSAAADSASRDVRPDTSLPRLRVH